jgi:lysozyme
MKKITKITLGALGILLMIGIAKEVNSEINITLDRKSEIAFGIDISQYQGGIEWDKVGTHHPIEFVIVRATMGKNRKDTHFDRNFQKAKDKGLMVGAYHYYDPNQHSLRQAKNYCDNVSLKKGDFVPIVDIERVSRIQSMDRLRLGLQRYLDVIEDHYGCKPVIYTGLSYWETYLKEDFSEYPLWVAAYSSKRRQESQQTSLIHQFSEKVSVMGIIENTVDGNDILRKNLKMLSMK